MLAFVALGDGRVRAFVIWILLATLFHKTAIILIPIAALSVSKRRIWTALWSGAIFAVADLQFTSDSTEVLWANYVESDYADASQGAGIRVAMNVIPAILLFFFRSRLFPEPGERRLIIGPNGAGKTTLFNLITGELTPDAGSIHLFGQDITKTPSRRRPHLGMARTYQIITLFPRDTIIHNVALALLGLSPARWNPLIDIKRQGHLIEHGLAALERVGLAHIAERPLAQTSYGERRRVEIAMALAQNPKLLLLDEPFAGLSIDERRDVQKLLLAIPRDVTIVMIEHNMDVALEFAERITLLHFGEVIVEGDRAEVVNNPRTREVYLGH